MRRLLVTLLIAGCRTGELSPPDDLPSEPRDLGPLPDLATNAEIIVDHAGTPRELAIDRVNQRIYWTDSSGGLLTRASTDGNGRHTVDQGDSFEYLTIDDDRDAYWSAVNAKQLRSISINPSVPDAVPPVVLVEQVTVRGIALQPSFLYYSTGGGIVRIGIDDIGITVLADSSSGAGAFSTLGFAAGDLYAVTIQQETNLFLYRVSAGSVAVFDMVPNTTFIAAPGAFYFQSETEISRETIADRKSTLIAQRTAANYRTTQLAVDDSYLYFIDTGGGTVRSAQLSDGSVTTIASGQGRPSGLAIDDQFVYWGTLGDGQTGDGTIVRHAKP